MKSIFFARSLLLSSLGYAQQVLSPNKKIKVVVEMLPEGQGGLGQAHFKVLYKKGEAYIEVLPASPLGILREDQQLGSMDYAPITFSNSQHPHITSFAHELALAVVFESGLQHFADRPSAYYDLADEPREFLKGFPTAWDETKLINGYPGEMVVIARRKGKLWYVAGLNGKNSPQTLQLNLDFLGNSDYFVQLFKDGADTKSITSETKNVKKSNTLQIQCLPMGGFAGVISVK